MIKILLLVFSFGVIVSGCKSTYLCTVDERIAVYTSADSAAPAAFFVPYGKNILAEKAKDGYRKVTYANTTGYIVKRKFSREIACSRTEIKRLYINSDSTYTFKKYKSVLADGQDSYSASTSAQANNQSGSLKTENKSTRTTSTPSSSGGPVHVKGYYRSNGTYVQPHTRSSPSRRR
jgi:hypothetical protein